MYLLVMLIVIKGKLILAFCILSVLEKAQELDSGDYSKILGLVTWTS